MKKGRSETEVQSKKDGYVVYIEDSEFHSRPSDARQLVFRIRTEFLLGLTLCYRSNAGLLFHPI
jgi:hypothetical protein